AHDVPHAAGFGTRIPDAHRAGHVGAVAVDDAPEVDDDELTRFHRSRTRASVGLRRVRARRDDRIEAVAARAATAHLHLELQREVALGGSFGEARQERAEASSAIEQAARMRATSAGSLISRS